MYVPNKRKLKVEINYKIYKSVEMSHNKIHEEEGRALFACDTHK